MNASDYFPTTLQQVQFADKYSRWSPDLRRREYWPESVDRVIKFLYKNCKVSYAQSEWDEMRRAMLELKVMPSMRVLQMGGPALERCNLGAFNCAYRVIDSIDAFAELLYVLMQGTGIGYSVEDRHVSKLPRIKRQKRGSVQTHRVEDSTEGWCGALKAGMHAWFNGSDIVFDTSGVRPAGSVLKIKGGQASGPQPLRDLLAFTRSTILTRQGHKLSTLDCHDICCHTGWIVQVGGVRRAALISLSDFEDSDIAGCKNGEFWNKYPFRSMSNNSAVHEEKPSAVDFMEEWLNLAKSGTGERGIFNRNITVPKRRKRKEFGVNPCSEIILRNMGLCNLSIAVARAGDSMSDLMEKVRIAAMFGTAQATLTKFNYVSSTWSENAQEEMLLGVDVTGQRDCEILQSGTDDILRRLKVIAVDTNTELSDRFGLNRSAAVTCVKPSGNSSVLLNCASGLHPRYAPYYIRRLRMGANSPVSLLLKDCGVLWFPETGHDTKNPAVIVFEFPVKSPEGAVFRHDLTAKQQFEYWLSNKENYTEHTASCTLYVEDHEWLSLGAIVHDNWDRIGGLSFLPKDNHIYPLAPYSDLTEEEYERSVVAFPKIDWSRLPEFESEDRTTLGTEYSCTSGACEL